MLALFGGMALIAATVVLGRAILGRTGAAADAGIVIAACIAAPYLIWSMSIRNRLFKFQKEGQITDRILHALNQLGAEKTVRIAATDARGNPQTVETTIPNIEIRTGGLLTLERIAQDSTLYDKGRDHVRVMEILCAYIRQNAPASTARDFPLSDWPALPDDAESAARQNHEMWRQARFADTHNGNARDWARSLPVPRVDIQMALNIVTQRTPAQRQAEADWGDGAPGTADWVFDSEPLPLLPQTALEDGVTAEEFKSFQHRLTGWREVIWAYDGYRPDLSNTNLQGANLSAALLCGARLEGARMEGANLAEARLEGARLATARMTGANLYAARLQGARLLETKMEGAYLRRARLEGALLTEARMEGALLYRARLEGADLRAARLDGADFGEARMLGANLTRAHMDGASLFGTRMAWANLFESQLQRASLFETQMEGADLRGARMEGAYVIRTRMDAGTSLNAASMIGAAMKEVDFADVKISSEQLLSTFGDATVTLPCSTGHARINRPEHWPNWALPVAVSDGNDFPTQWNVWQNRPDAYTPPPPPGT
ncbi:Type III effector pipB2 [Thalassovita gelatinovora]|uniref:Type III effector pipB2 n=2 Tax=Thalassovita gelatinovora TaxID=53501 RepID=A0A0P1FXE0_THAGE|nr:Type III effector pipB2 [Thalassovita gelatinovora]SEQ82481.1 Uncharacterized protein YjbI, contains pentapeptide repeats [Thalassovita gelatinovora]